MSKKNDLFKSIMGSLSSDEAGVLAKTAGVTEDLSYPAQKKDEPVNTEKKLGLAGLPANGGTTSTETMSCLANVSGGLSGMATEGIPVKKMPVDAPTYLSKKAAIYHSLSEAAGFDLEKVAGDTAEEDFLLKQAMEIMNTEALDLDKIATDMANTMADRFIERVRGA